MPSIRTSPQPGALDAAGLRRVVAVLSAVQIVSWGCLYYAFAALQSSITADTGWSGVAVTGAFSLSQVVAAVAGLWVGRHIDAHGPRTVMTLASLLAVPGLLGVALAPTLPCSSPAGSWSAWPWPARCTRRRSPRSPTGAGAVALGALTTLTLVAGLASTVFAPLASLLDDLVGWRLALPRA